MADTKQSAGKAADAEDEAPESILVVDIGKKQSKKKIRKLRKGRGPLIDKVGAALEEMREQGAIAADAQPVVIIVREKRRRWHRRFGWGPRLI